MRKLKVGRPILGLVVALVTAAFAALVPVGMSVAQDASTGAPIQIGNANDGNPQPWTVNCSSQPSTGELICTMSQVLIATDSKQRLIGASVYRPQQSSAAVMRLSLPHGVLLQKGVDFWVDDAQAVNIPIIIADPNGSYADVDLSGKVILGLQAGTRLHLGVTAGNGERIEFSLSLKGFTAAFAKL